MIPDYETIIGLEVHLQLKTKAKLFCSCPTRFGAQPNTNTCPFCLGQSGVPELNDQALRQGLKAALALNCHLAPQVFFDRKYYQAPDLPKGYQITQRRAPLGKDGFIQVEVEGDSQTIPIRQVHLEEDAGRLLESNSETRIDFNRAGMPLLEIVTPPVFRSSQVVRAYLQALQLLMRYLDVSDARVEEGSMRCELNISLRPRGSQEMGELVEVKNIGSFSGVVGALAYEEKRQTALLAAGKDVLRQTRGWDEGSKKTYPQREKEEHYQYEEEPGLPPRQLSTAEMSALQATLPELPLARQRRYIESLGLSPYAASELVKDPALSLYFEQVLSHHPAAVSVANWLLTELRALLNEAALTISDSPLPPLHLAQLLDLVQEGSLSHNQAKELLTQAFAEGKSPAALAQARGLRQEHDQEQVARWVKQVLTAHPRVVEQYLQGKERASGYLMGQIMKISGGRAHPRLAQTELKQALKRVR